MWHCSFHSVFGSLVVELYGLFIPIKALNMSFAIHNLELKAGARSRCLCMCVCVCVSVGGSSTLVHL